MVILVNAVSSLMGGVRTVARELTAAMATIRPEHRFVLCYASPEIGCPDYPGNVERLHLPALVSRPRRWLWEQTRLPAVCRERRVDIVLSLGGYICFALKRPQVSVWQRSAGVRAPPVQVKISGPVRPRKQSVMVLFCKIMEIAPFSNEIPSIRPSKEQLVKITSSAPV